MIAYNVALRFNLWWLFTLKKPVEEIAYLSDKRNQIKLKTKIPVTSRDFCISIRRLACFDQFKGLQSVIRIYSQDVNALCITFAQDHVSSWRMIPCSIMRPLISVTVIFARAGRVAGTCRRK